MYGVYRLVGWWLDGVCDGWPRGWLRWVLLKRSVRAAFTIEYRFRQHVKSEILPTTHNEILKSFHLEIQVASHTAGALALCLVSEMFDYFYDIGHVDCGIAVFTVCLQRETIFGMSTDMPVGVWYLNVLAVA